MREADDSSVILRDIDRRWQDLSDIVARGPAGGRGVCDYVELWARRSGCFASEDIRRGRGHLVLGAPEDERASVALLFVLPPEEEGRVHRYIDGALATVLSLLESVAIDELDISPLLVLLSEDEAGELPIQACFEDHELERCDLVIGLSPTNLVVELGAVGEVMMRYRFGAVPGEQTRVNASEPAGDFLVALKQRPSEIRLIEGIRFKNTEVAVSAEGRSDDGRLCNRFFVNVLSSFAPGVALPEHKEILRALGEDCEIIYERAALPVPLASPLIEGLAALSSQKMRGGEKASALAPLSNIDVDALHFGPGLDEQSVGLRDWLAFFEMLKSYLG